MWFNFITSTIQKRVLSSSCYSCSHNFIGLLIFVISNILRWDNQKNYFTIVHELHGIIRDIYKNINKKEKLENTLRNCQNLAHTKIKVLTKKDIPTHDIWKNGWKKIQKQLFTHSPVIDGIIKRCSNSSDMRRSKVAVYTWRKYQQSVFYTSRCEIYYR